jgi:hypothetical protein
VADDADHLAAGVQRVQGGQRHFQRVAVQRAKAFVQEQRVDRGLVADQIGQRQCQRQADQEASPPESVRVSRAASPCQLSTMSSSSSPVGLRRSR